MTMVFNRRFHIPTAVAELDCQPVEQLGMRGGSPCAPKSSDVLTSPVPKSICQKRLTVTRAVSGWSGLTSQLARAEPVVRDLQAWRQTLRERRVRPSRRGAS